MEPSTNPKNLLYEHLWPAFHHRRALLARVVSGKDTYDKYDRAFVKEIRVYQRTITSGILGSSIICGSVVMAYTPYFQRNGILPGVLKMMLLWTMASFVSDIVKVDGVLKVFGPRLSQVAVKHSL